MLNKSTSQIIFGNQLFAVWANSKTGSIEEKSAENRETRYEEKVLFVRIVGNGLSDRQLFDIFKQYDQYMPMKRIRDFAFFYFCRRQDALKAINDLNYKIFYNSKLEISFALEYNRKKQQDNSKREFNPQSINFYQAQDPIINPPYKNPLVAYSRIANEFLFNNGFGLGLNQMFQNSNQMSDTKPSLKRKLSDRSNDFSENFDPSDIYSMPAKKRLF